jgi:flagellum-specific peptidoglycan hydrolase FlgJ
MNWKFFKTNWFTATMVLIVLVLIARKYFPSHFGSAQGQPVRGEKFTEQKGKQESASFLGLISGGGPGKSQRMPQVEMPVAEAFLRRFAKVALSEHKKFGTPASVILACAYVNSFAGQRDAASAANNFFALPCSDGWEGESAQIGGHCVRKYETAWASFRDFSIYLSSQEWFGALRKSAGKDSKAWAKQLGAKGISDVENFGAEVARVIEEYQLARLDGEE